MAAFNEGKVFWGVSQWKHWTVLCLSTVLIINPVPICIGIYRDNPILMAPNIPYYAFKYEAQTALFKYPVRTVQ